MSRSMLPPRKKDAIPGRAQIGLFIRFKDGATIESVTPVPTEAVERGAEWLLHMIACAKGCKLCRDLRLSALQGMNELKQRIEARAEECAPRARTKAEQRGRPL